MKKEEVRLERTENGVTANSLRDYIPDTSPRYHFFLFKHTFEGHHEESVGMSRWDHSRSMCVVQIIVCCLEDMHNTQAYVYFLVKAILHVCYVYAV